MFEMFAGLQRQNWAIYLLANEVEYVEKLIKIKLLEISKELIRCQTKRDIEKSLP